MMISKFPIKTTIGEYKVSIFRQYVALGLYRWIAKIYIERSNKCFYQRKFKRVYQYETGWSRYDEIAKDLIKFAEDSVLTYEHSIEDKYRKDLGLTNAVNEFKNWSGIVRGKEDDK